MKYTLVVLFMRCLATFFMFALFAFGCAEETSKPECDGDGKDNGCPSGEYCATDNTCCQDCTVNSECDYGEICTDDGKCILWEE